MVQEQKYMVDLIQIPYKLRALFTFQDGRHQTAIKIKMVISQLVFGILYNTKNKKNCSTTIAINVQNFSRID